MAKSAPSSDMKTGVFINTTRGKGQRGWEREFAFFRKFIQQMGLYLQHGKIEHQNATAHVIANLYRNFLRNGIDPENRPLTQILGGVKPALSGLADHVIVSRAKAGKGPDGADKPTYIKFWTEEWDKIALLQDRGYFMIITPDQRRALFARAMANGYPPEQFLDSAGDGGDGAAGYVFWEVPARPHLHYLDPGSSPAIKFTMKLVQMEIQRRVSKYGEDGVNIEAAFAKLKKDTSTSRPVPTPYVKRRMGNIDDIQVAESKGDED